MPRYELIEGMSNKFWEVTLDGTSFTTVWGKIGTAGQSTTKTFDSAGRAQLEHDKLVAEKVKKGYQLKGAATTAVPAAPAPLAPTPAPAAAGPHEAQGEAEPPPPMVLHWTAELAAAAAKARGTVDPAGMFSVGEATGAATDTASAFARLRAAFSGRPREFVEKALARENLTRAKDELVTRMVAVYGGADEAFDPGVEGVAMVLLPAAFAGLVALDTERVLIASWVARAGLVGALEAFVQGLGPFGALSSAPLKLAWLSPSPERVHATGLPEACAAELHAQLAAAAPAERARVGARAAELRAEASLATRIRLAQLLSDGAWVDEDLAHYAAAPAPVVFPAVALLGASPARLAAFVAGMSLAQALELGAHRGSQQGSATPFALAYLDARREEAVAPLAAWLTRIAALYDPAAYHTLRLVSHMAELFATLRCVEHAPAVLGAAIAVLGQLAGEKLAKDVDPRPAALDCVVRSPRLALPILREAGKGRGGTWARELLPRVERLAGAAVVHPVASDAEVPPLLRGKVAFKPPPYWTPAAFAPPLLIGDKALPPAAMAALGGLLAKGDADALAEVRASCVPASLTAFAWDVFMAWVGANAPPKEKWAFLALGHFGDDGTARKLTPLIRAWPGESQHARAVTGLDVLATIGSDVAMMMLNGIAQKVKFKGLQEKAREKMDEIAARRGLTAEELADRLVPDLDLEEDGSKVLDFGPRSFRVGFDETLSPFVTDATGTRLKDLPKPNQKDETELASSAVETWKAMKKDAKALAALEILRLELAMGNARRWRAQDFETFLVHHPLLGHLVRRVVWGTFDGGVLGATFRVAEDRSYADRSDDAFGLGADATVGVVHRLQLTDEDVSAWSTVFRDYSLAQPFAQLEREVYRLAPEELAGEHLRRFEKRKVETKRVMGLLTRGWRKGAPMDGGFIQCVYKPIGKDLNAALEVSGLDVTMEYTEPTQELGAVDFGPPDAECGVAPQLALPLASIDPIVMSEIVRDLESLGRIGEA